VDDEAMNYLVANLSASGLGRVIADPDAAACEHARNGLRHYIREETDELPRNV
jgi:hypothetical protein